MIKISSELIQRFNLLFSATRGRLNKKKRKRKRKKNNLETEANNAVAI